MDLSFESFKEEENNFKSSFWDFKGEYDFVDEWYLMSTPIPILIITSIYLAFVLKIGPNLMKYRSPYKLTTLLAFYNAAQVIASFYLFTLALNLIKQEGLFQKKCITKQETINQITSGIYSFLICKLTEFLDTVFFVLRKKQNQVTFLHVYHHTLTVLSSWLILKYEPSYIGVFLGLINGAVHMVMYTYYGLSAFPSLTKYLWWKKYITKMQVVQFVLILLQVLISQATSECKVSKITTTFMSVNLVLFIYLFMQFYIQAYSDKNNNMNNNNNVKNKSLNRKTINNHNSKNNVKFSIGHKPIHVNNDGNNTKKNI